MPKSLPKFIYCAVKAWEPGASLGKGELERFCAQFASPRDGKMSVALRYVVGHNGYDGPCLIASSEPLQESQVAKVLEHWRATDDNAPETVSFSVPF